MNKYSQCIDYLHSLGLSLPLCRKVCGKYEKEQDFEGLLQYILICERLVECCVD